MGDDPPPIRIVVSVVEPGASDREFPRTLPQHLYPSFTPRSVTLLVLVQRVNDRPLGSRSRSTASGSAFVPFIVLYPFSGLVQPLQALSTPATDTQHSINSSRPSLYRVRDVRGPVELCW